VERIEWIERRERFAALAPLWDALAARQPTPFLLSAWLEPWLDAFARRRRLRVLALWRDERLVGGVPLLDGFRQSRAPVNDHTPAFGVLAADEDALGRLAEELLSVADGLVLPALDGEDPALARLHRAATAEGRLVHAEPMHVTLWTATDGELESYLSRIPSKRRSELRRLRRKAEREHELRIRAVEVPVDPAAALARMVELEAAGWKGRGGTAIASAASTERFYRALAGRFHALGALRLSELTLDGSAAALELGILHRGRLFTPKSAYDERLRSLAPGIVLQMAAIERCFELGLQAYDFTGPAYEYERPFATGERRLQRLRIYRREPLGAGRHLYHRRVRPVLRRAQPRRMRALRRAAASSARALSGRS
jgi:CelD/BcsL family acetyltransferase involved in cellulose biosynthesis